MLDSGLPGEVGHRLPPPFFRHHAFRADLGTDHHGQYEEDSEEPGNPVLLGILQRDTVNASSAAVGRTSSHALSSTSLRRTLSNSAWNRLLGSALAAR